MRHIESTNIEAVADQNSDKFIVDKTTYAFYGSSLKRYLLDRGVNTVVVCGAMTNLRDHCSVCLYLQFQCDIPEGL